MYVRGKEDPTVVSKALQTCPVPSISCVLGTCRAISIPSTTFSHLPTYCSLFFDHSPSPHTSRTLSPNIYSSFSSQIRYPFFQKAFPSHLFPQMRFGVFSLGFFPCGAFLLFLSFVIVYILHRS